MEFFKSLTSLSRLKVLLFPSLFLFLFLKVLILTRVSKPPESDYFSGVRRNRR